MLDRCLVIIVISALLFGGTFARLSTVWQYLDHGWAARRRLGRRW
jgi:hypothetical protein